MLLLLFFSAGPDRAFDDTTMPAFPAETSTLPTSLYIAQSFGRFT
jgi:hypothetical protein